MAAAESEWKTPAIATGQSESPYTPSSFSNSGALADSEISGLTKLLRTLRRRQSLFLVVFGLTTALLAADSLRQRILSPVYLGGFRLLVSDPLDNGRPGGGADLGGGIVESVARSSVSTDIPTLIELLRSPLLLKPIAEKQGIPLGSLIGNLSIGTSGADVEGVLDIRLRWGDPVQGRQILTSLSETYPYYALLQRQDKLGQGLTFLDQQAPELNQRVNVLQQELKRFREANGFLEPIAQGGSIIGERDTLLAQQRALQVQQAELETQLVSIREGKLTTIGTTGAPLSPGRTNRANGAAAGNSATGTRLNAELGLATAPPAPGNLPPSGTTATPQQQLSQLEQEIATAKATYRPDSPQLQSLLAQRDNLKPLVTSQSTDQVTSALFSNTAQQDELSRQILLLNQNFLRNPEKVRQYDELQDRLNVARQSYLSYIQARESFRLEVAKETVPWKVIAPPEFGDIPVEPDLPNQFLRALFFGLALGIGAVMLRERTDHVYHNPKEAEQELKLPVLGLIPYLPLNPNVPILTSLTELSGTERFAIKESLRSLFTTFRILRADREIRLIVMTSSTQGEGKSMASTIFANTLADLGQRVLLVDADMRIPVLHKNFGIDNVEGLSTLLGDTNRQLEELIHPYNENLSILTAGPRAPDPAKLLNSKRCVELVQQIRNLPGYDMVIFDTPPCLMLSDPILLGEKVDGILYLVGLGRVSRELAPQAVQRIRSTGVDVLGMICNQVTYPTRLNDYGYEYGYHYHYAYAGGYRDTYAKQRQSKAEEAKSAEQPSVDAETRRLVGNYANSADVQTRLGQDDTLAEDSSQIAKAARPSINRFLPRWGRRDR